MKHLSLPFLLLASLILVGCMHTPKSDPVPDNKPLPVEDIIDIIDTLEEEPAPPAAAFAPSAVEGNGTEPFWNFVVSGTNLVWTEPSMAGPITSTNYSVALTQSGTDILINGVGFSATLTLGSCSDGMSGLPFAYSAAITKGAQTFNGCANVTP